MLLVSPTGAVVDAAPETVQQLLARGFRAAEKPQTDKAEETPKPRKKAKK